MTAPEGFLFVADFLDTAEQTELLSTLSMLEYAHDTFRGQRLKRGYAQFGYAYVSIGRKLELTQAMPTFLKELASNALIHCPSTIEFNQCIITHYPPKSGIGWHTDAPIFGECIVGISLGSNSLFQFRQNGTDDVAYEIEPQSGSLYRMQGPSRWEYQHQVVPVRSERYSLTFRHVSSEFKVEE